MSPMRSRPSTPAPGSPTPSISSMIKDTFHLSSRRKAQLRTACSGLKTVLETANGVADNAGVPGLSMGISGLIHVLDIAEKMGQNAEDIEALSVRIKHLMDILEAVSPVNTRPKEVNERFEKLGSILVGVSEEVKQRKSGGFFKRLLNHEEDVLWVSERIKAVAEAIGDFELGTVVRTEAVVDNIQEDIQAMNTVVETFIFRALPSLLLQSGLKLWFTIFRKRYNYRTFSGFHMLPRRPSWQRKENVAGTQQGPASCPKFPSGSTLTVSSLYQGNHPTRTLLVTMTHAFFWMNGAVGTGKTTIAATVAQGCLNQQPSALGASFFCSRDDKDCSDLCLIFTTIAYQLAHFHPGFSKQISLVRQANPEIGGTYPEQQLRKLIVEPLSSVRNSFPPCIVVVDALDECKDTATTSAILAALSKHVTNLAPLRFFITSRPEHHITDAMSSPQFHNQAQKFNLHEVELPVVQQDIQQYLLVKLQETALPNDLKAEALKLIVQQSAGLFIYASTAIKFIRQPDFVPQEQLQIIFTANAARELGSPTHELDTLYTQVLQQTPQCNRETIQQIIGSIALLQTQLPALHLARLLALDPGKLRGCLVRLHSVILVPDDNDKGIRLLHPSFFDFLSSPTRCLMSEFAVHLKEQHSRLAKHCLDIMIQTLKQNICQVGDPSLRLSEISDISTQIATHIPLHVQYACRAYHFLNGEPTTATELLEEFLSQHLLHWIEVSSLLGDLRNALLGVTNMHQHLMQTPPTMTTTLLSDSKRFIHTFFDVIAAFPLQCYHSALLFTPTDTKLRIVYGSIMDHRAKVYNAVPQQWSSCLQIIENHGPTLQGHSDLVQSVAFSIDGKHLVSGSNDTTVRIWEVVTATELYTLQGYSDTVHSVGFSPDGKHVVSGSYDNNVRTWDVVTGTKLCTFQGHSMKVNSVGFSSDGRHIVSGSNDKTVGIWDAGTGTELHTRRGQSDQVRSVVFSPDGRHIASGSDDSTVRIWDAVAGTELQALQGHSGCVWCVAFSSDGKHVVSGSEDKTVRIWDAVTSTELHTFHGHSNPIYSVAFSPDDLHIVSGSDDQTVRIWDTVTGTELHTLEGHSGLVKSVVFPPDGRHISSGSADSTVCIWDAVTGTELHKLQGHSNWVRSVVFSPDGRHIASGSDDSTVRTWDAVTGTELRTLQGPEDS
ncbi:WD40-repeat-containing domain protein, partial [Mycena albidolilacea]